MKYDFVIDVDDTICFTKDRNYKNAVPNQPVIDKINTLINNGYSVLLYSARGQLSLNSDIDKINSIVLPVLVDWLKENNVMFTSVRIGKPFAAVGYVDDKSMTLEEFILWENS